MLSTNRADRKEDTVISPSIEFWQNNADVQVVHCCMMPSQRMLPGSFQMTAP